MPRGLAIPELPLGRIELTALDLVIGGRGAKKVQARVEAMPSFQAIQEREERVALVRRAVHRPYHGYSLGERIAFAGDSVSPEHREGASEPMQDERRILSAVPASLGNRPSRTRPRIGLWS